MAYVLGARTSCVYFFLSGRRCAREGIIEVAPMSLCRLTVVHKCTLVRVVHTCTSNCKDAFIVSIGGLATEEGLPSIVSAVGIRCHDNLSHQPLPAALILSAARKSDSAVALVMRTGSFVCT